MKNLLLKIDAGKITEQQKGKFAVSFLSDEGMNVRFQSEAYPLCVVGDLLQMAS